MKTETKGIIYASIAYITWGVVPIYWKLLSQVPALHVLCYRILWSWTILFLAILLLFQWKSFYTEIKQPKILFIYSIAAILIGINWLVFVWAVQTGYVINASLGFFISPLASVLIGVLFLQERLRLMQWIAIGIASVGVGYLIFFYGELPWIGLTMAIAFGFYGLIKKQFPLNSFYSLALETSALLPMALFYLLYAARIENNVWLHTNIFNDFLLIGGGVVTIMPLAMFAYATQSISLSLAGFLQYISPVLQFLIGKFIFHETFSSAQFIGFALIWTSLIIFSLDGYKVWVRRKKLNYITC